MTQPQLQQSSPPLPLSQQNGASASQQPAHSKNDAGNSESHALSLVPCSYHEILESLPANEHIQALPAATLAASKWTGDTNGISRQWQFPDFLSAMRFMATAAPAVDALGHHPEWRNVYNTVWATCRTHSAGNTVTPADLQLANILEGHAGACQGI